MSNQAGSRRWTHFYSALQLAIQRSAHKWTFDDFAECFPLYVEEDKNGASATFNTISEYAEAQIFRDIGKLFKDYNVQENIDILHNVVKEAKEREAAGEATHDMWREDIEPRTAVAARTVPVLEAEVKRLRESLAEVEGENRQLQSRLEQNMTEAEEADEQTLEFLEKVDQVYKEWQKLPMDDIEAWTVQTQETLKPTLRS
ncbi:hypothetical protein BDQ12DRAFT_704868 [Crucibulum laeve]|uniref:Nnf1-domain-containing protein n=1 Tax=Crucibulum laeve TaxID=68775 RepID=A0A5C3M3G3_9AGAR|nr:hypothetical protein BDQ12DRAFT_704868 [Crucibulum laeve]